MEVKPLYIVCHIDDANNITSYFHSGRNCNVGAYETIEGARKAVGYCKRYNKQVKVFKVTGLDEV